MTPEPKLFVLVLLGIIEFIVGMGIILYRKKLVPLFKMNYTNNEEFLIKSRVVMLIGLAIIVLSFYTVGRYYFMFFQSTPDIQ